jgi:hypothetical protein
MIFCTGGAFSPRGVLLADRFVDRVLHKPFSTDALRTAVSRIARSPVLPST